ncbi:MAG TPA: SPOR domain-containing protein [Puia sp.]|nr:SPOR domain-containing protein [Puia sp.]
MYKLFLAFLLITSRAAAQGGDTSRMVADSSAPVVVEKDPRIDQLIRKHMEANDLATRESRRYVPGFRILVINSPDRQMVFAAKAKIYEQFPDWKSYLFYQSPNYKLKVGNFKTVDEAEDAMRQLSRLFSSGLYVIPDTIELKLSDVPKADTTNP